ncbi:MAG: branched-chain amino acid ABC transporter permease [Nanoarchaeota archaeon]
MSFVVQLTINGLIAGSVYALVASGFSLIYSTNRFMHFAHGISVVVASYILYTLFSIAQIPFFLSILPTLFLSALFGFFVYLLVYSPLQSRNASNVVLLIASIGVLILFQNVLQAVYGANVKTINLLETNKGIEIFGASVTHLQLVIIFFSLFLFIFFNFFMRKTRLGKEMRAIADNKELSRIVGINDRLIAGASFVIGSFFAGIAGIFIGLEYNLFPTMGTDLIIKGFTGAVIGGVGSVPGAIIGAYILGLAENYGIAFLPSGFKDAISFVLLFIFLLFKPSGLLGIRRNGE